MSSIDVSDVVEVDASAAYAHGRTIEALPRFMSWLDAVERISPSEVRFTGRVLGRRRVWQARVRHEDDRRRIRWRSVEGADNKGSVTFDEAGDGRTRIRLVLEFEPETLGERTSAALGLFDAQAKADLERFGRYLQRRVDTATGHEDQAMRPGARATSSRKQ